MAPSPDAMARDPAGSSSTEIVSTASRPAMARFRDSSCRAVTTARLGDAAVSTVSPADRPKAHRAMRRRPTRSARTMAAMVTTTPIRTTANTVACWPGEPLPMSALTKVRTWVSRPKSSPATTLNMAMVATTVDCRGDIRSGMVHHGRTPAGMPSGSVRRRSGS